MKVSGGKEKGTPAP